MPIQKLSRREMVALAAATGAVIPDGANSAPGNQGSMVPRVIPYAPASGMSAKAWARAHLKGLESFILPSVAPDMRTLDEEGVRVDVRHAIKQGFVSVLPMPIGLDRETGRRMEMIVADEAKGHILVVGTLRHGMAGTQETPPIDYSHVLLVVDPRSRSDAEIYESLRSAAERTSTPIILYAASSASLRSLHPSGVPIAAFSRLADLPNVVGVKLSQTLNAATAWELAEAVGDRLLLGPVDLGLAPLLANKYTIQWSGQWAVDAIQSPDAPHAVEFLRLLAAGRRQDAIAAYWRFEPAATAFYALQSPYLAKGQHPWLHIKYYQWLTGGNGGLLPVSQGHAAQIATLEATARQACRAALKAIGAQTVDLPDEVFLTGSAAHARGARAKDIPPAAQYAA